MKVVFLNAWNAKVRDAMAAFIKEQSQDTDVFCFQEVYDDMKTLARDLLPGYAEVEKYKYVNDNDNFPQATYVKNSTSLISSAPDITIKDFSVPALEISDHLPLVLEFEC